MKTPSDGWDRDEQEVLELEGLRSDLESVRARLALAPEAQTRLLARIQREARQTHTARSWQWGFALLAASVFLVIGTISMLRREQDAAVQATKPESTVAVAKPAPVFVLPLDKPDLKVSPSALAWRGPKGDNTLLADLKPAFDAFRAGDYALADREFAALSGTYPRSVEIALYQGVARLFLGNVAGATENLTAAEKLADRSFASDIAWYRAVADERAGNLASARARLTVLCAESNARKQAACDALSRLPGTPAP